MIKMCRRWLSQRSALRGLPVKLVELHGMLVIIIIIIITITFTIITKTIWKESRWRKRKKWCVCGCTGMGTTRTHLLSPAFQLQKITILSFFTFYNLKKTASFSFSCCRSWPKPCDSRLLYGANQVHEICQAVCQLKKMREDQVWLLLGTPSSSFNLSTTKDAKNLLNIEGSQECQPLILQHKNLT